MSEHEATLFGIALVADGDVDRGKGIAEACTMRGLVTRFAAHGAEALEAALAEPPDVVVAALGLPLIDAPQLAGILRANPRTQGVRFLVVGGAPGEPLAHAAIDAHVAAPVDPEVVLRRIETLLARQRVGPEAPRRGVRESDLEGKLAQLGLVDLLQLFHMNRKTGCVELVRRGPDGGEERGRVAVTDGNVVDARCGAVDGEKALYRLLGWRTGSFSFTRTRPGGAARIHTPTRALLLEGMRQLDELARLRTELPSLNSEVAIRMAPGETPPFLQPLTREVLGLLQAFPRVGDVVDRSPQPDYQVLRTLRSLLERGILELRTGKGGPSVTAAATLFSAAQLGRLREWAQRSHGTATPIRDARLLLASPEPDATRDFLSLLEQLPEVRLDRAFRERRFSSSTLGRIGRLGPEQEVGIEILHLPTHPSGEPLWRLASLSALGILYLAQEPTAEGAGVVQAVRRRIEQHERLRSFHAVLERKPQRLSTREIAAELGLRADAALIRLPVGPAQSWRLPLAQLLASLVP